MEIHRAFCLPSLRACIFVFGLGTSMQKETSARNLDTRDWGIRLMPALALEAKGGAEISRTAISQVEAL
jgi:hypothetical protein